MTTFPGSPKLMKGGIVLLNPSTSAVQCIVSLTYNSDTLTQTLQVQGTGGAGGNRSESLRLKGPPVEAITLETEIDAADQRKLPHKCHEVGEACVDQKRHLYTEPGNDRARKEIGPSIHKSIIGSMG